MSSFHREYRDAFNAAVDLARLLKKECGLEGFSEYGKYPGYRVFSLPKAENRHGFELRCQVVRPDEPKTSRPERPRWPFITT